jgi:hypothetical protein
MMDNIMAKNKVLVKDVFYGVFIFRNGKVAKRPYGGCLWNSIEDAKTYEKIIVRPYSHKKTIILEEQWSIIKRKIK